MAGLGSPVPNCGANIAIFFKTTTKRKPKIAFSPTYLCEIVAISQFQAQKRCLRRPVGTYLATSPAASGAACLRLFRMKYSAMAAAPKAMNPAPAMTISVTRPGT